MRYYLEFNGVFKIKKSIWELGVDIERTTLVIDKNIVIAYGTY